MNKFKRILSLSAVALGLACGSDELLTDPTSGLAPAGSVSYSIGVGTSGETIATDKNDYSPGETVTMTGTGWEPGEMVRLVLTEDPEVHGPREWDVQADAEGKFTDTSFSPQEDHFGVTFTLTATGLSSGFSAETSFTDGTFHWVGCESTDWTDKDNWATSYDACSGSVPQAGKTVTAPPTSADNVEIRAGRGSPVNNPILQTNASITALLISGSGTSGGVLTIQGVNGKLTIAGTELKLDESGKLRLLGGRVEGYTKLTLNTTNNIIEQSGGTLSHKGEWNNKGKVQQLVPSIGTVEFLSGGGTVNGWPSGATNDFQNVVITSETTVSFSASAGITISVKGDWTNNGIATLTSNATTVVFNGSGNQNVGGANSTTFRNATNNKPTGDLILTKDQTVNITLTLTSGNIVTGANTLISPSTGVVSRPATGGHVIGKLQRHIPTGNPGTVTYDIGTASAYTPFIIDVDGTAGTAGGLIGSTSGVQHPNIGSSGLNPFVARHWTLSTSGVTGTAAALAGRTYKLRLQFLDNEAGNPNTASEIRRWDGTNWNAPTGTHTRGVNFTENSSFSAFSDFVVGTPGPVVAATALAVAPASGTFGGTTTLSATLTSGGNPVPGKSISFELNGNAAGSATTNASGVASLAGVSLTGINAGTYPNGVAGSFAGDAGYTGSNGSNTLTVNKAAGSVSINNIPSNAIVGGSFVAAYDKAGDGTASVASLTASTCSVSGNTVNFDAAGTCTLKASVTEGTNHLAATGAEQGFTIGVGATALSVAPASGTFGGTTTLSATLTSGGNPVSGKSISFTLNGDAAGTATTNALGVVTLSSVSLSGINAGTYPGGVAASFAGNGAHGPSNGSNTLTVNKAAGSVSINNIPSNAVVGGSFVATYTKAGNGTPSVTSLSETICSVSGNTVNFLTAGSCELQASVTEGTNHEAATGAEQSFDIEAAPTSLAVAPASGTFDGTTALSATLTAGGNPVSGKSIAFTLNGDAAGTATTNASGVATLSSVSLSGINAGTYPGAVAASFAGNGSYAASNGSNTLTINKAAGSVSISNLPSSGLVGGSFSPTYAKTGDGTPSTISLATSVCSVSGTSVNFVGVGTCKLQASVTEGTNHLTASGAEQSFIVGYAFGGFLPPVDRPNTLNSSKAGQAVPLKWRLLDASNQPVLNLANVKIRVTHLNCNNTPITDALEEYASGPTGLQNHGDGYYQFNWKTPSDYANSCRTIGLDFGDGYVELAVAFFTFKK